ncbi:uroporphyrinogen decarboxylase family protein [Candidatus Magnetaquicoccus inordinatus]|uniref:uroporphyrinogen decarboxylase family protein n=1 Tax=Candidatus Magnetaquicoccus inordinatus TaxID=2496818 RepID=UPI001D0E5252|nr:uroporphyrinogen decarboxylase family protein [Candidatus Magnetaquicoccus inordinatus]
MMTSMEIVRAALQGNPAPRIPIFCNLLDQGAPELGMSQAEYYARGEHVACGQLALRTRYGYDNLWSLFYVGREAELLGCQEILFAEDGTPNVADYFLRTAKDIESFTIPEDITRHPVWQESARCLQVLRQESKGRFPICAYLTASTTLPALLMGMDKWLELALSGPDHLRAQLLGKCSEFFRKQVAAYREAGADLLLYSSPFGSSSFVGMRRFRAFSLPWMQRDLTGLGVEDLIYYCGTAPINPVIGEVMQHLGLRVFYPSPKDDLAVTKALVAGNGLTCGVIDDISMISWTPEQTRAEVERLCHIGMPGEHFLLGTAVMPMAVPEANIQAYMEAAFTFGSYR